MTETPHGFRHDAFLYRSEDEFCDRVAGFLDEGLAAGHAAVAATTSAHIEVLRDALGRSGDRVSFLPSDEWFRRPPSTIAGFGTVVEGLLADGARGVRVVGEIDWGTTARQWTEWSRYESLLNRVFAGSPVSMVCPYAVGSLATEVLDGTCRTHPHLIEGGVRSPSPGYAEPADFLATMPAPGPIVDASVLAEFRVESDLGALRRAVIAAGGQSGLTEERVDEAVLAVNELVTNALLHGLRPVVVRLLADDDHFYCEVRDAGAGIADPFAGLLPPDEERVAGGRGLWMAGLLSDGLEIGSVEDGTLTRVVFRRRPAPQSGASVGGQSGMASMRPVTSPKSPSA
ncbi:MAG TPA: anti-sigma factor RsbA family regulatory protein [Acidimicrobiales bacterium]